MGFMKIFIELNFSHCRTVYIELSENTGIDTYLFYNAQSLLIPVYRLVL